MIPDVTWYDILLRLAVAGALTGAIGLERELRERAAGLRTHMLVGTGSALFTIVSAYGWSEFQFSAASGVVFDPTRIAAQIVTGIGFIGAGAIIRQGASVRGLTTAAGLWVAAAIGMAAGAGYFTAALIATGVVLVGLVPFRWIEGEALEPFRRGARVLEIDLVPQRSIAEVLGVLDASKIRPHRFEVEDETERRRLRVEVEGTGAGAAEGAVDELAGLEGVRAVRWRA